MAWDTEGTRRRLKEAATAEFAEHGPDGTTMARIAERAGINKERLYKYFGDKQALFETVLTDELDKLAASVAPVPSGFEEIGEFAGRTFDYQAAHPQLVRLLLWEGLSGGVADEANRMTHYEKKVQAYAAAQREGVLDDELSPEHLVFMIIGLAAWWISAPQLARMLTGLDDSDPAEHARRRASVVSAADARIRCTCAPSSSRASRSEATEMATNSSPISAPATPAEAMKKPVTLSGTTRRFCQARRR